MWNSRAERRVLKELRAGRVAKVTQGERLSGRFLVKLFLDPGYRDARDGGVRIEGATFEDDVDLERLALSQDFWLKDCHFRGELKLRHLSSTRTLSLEKSEFFKSVDLCFARTELLNLSGVKVEKDLGLTGIHVQADLQLEKAKILGSVEIFNAKVDQTVNLRCASVCGGVTMSGIHVGADLDMRCDEEERKYCGVVTLDDAVIDNDLRLEGAKFAGALRMDHILVKHDLFFGLKSPDRPKSMTECREIRMLAAKAGCSFFINWVECLGEALMESISADVNLFIQHSIFHGGVDMRCAKIGVGLYLQSKFHAEVNLTGAEIKGDLHLKDLRDSQLPEWGTTGRLVLQNARVEGIDCPRRNKLEGVAPGKRSRAGWLDVLAILRFKCRRPRWILERCA